MGGKSEESAYIPNEAKDNLKSRQHAKILDLLGEGPLTGWGNGEDILKSIYLNDTPILSSSGNPNFKGVKVQVLSGTEDQSYLPDFDTTENTISVGAEVFWGTPIVRTVTDSQVDSLIVTVRTGQMVRVSDKGDQDETSVELYVNIFKDSELFVREKVRIKGKTSDHFFKDVMFDNLPEVPFQIQVERLDQDSTTSKLQNKTYFASYVEIVNAKLSYPHSAVVGIEFNSELFGSSLPTRNYLVKGLQLKVPSNYDPVARTYTGFWDGTFKVAYSNNPAWVFYDLVTSKRYGLGRKISTNQVDKWGLYSVAQYCDQLVDNGQGTMEPRFTCNAYLTESRQAYEVLQDLVSCFRGMYVWDGQNVSVTIDRKSDPVAVYTNSNVVDGIFSYSSSPLTTVATAVQIQYVDSEDGYRTKTEYVSDDAAIRRYGLNVKRITSFGCTSRSQAIRTGKWLLETSRLERQSVTFGVGRAGLRHLPYDIIQVVDNDYAGVDTAGRIESVTGTDVVLDRDVSEITGTEFSYLGADGEMKKATIASQVNSNTLKLIETITPHVSATFVIRSKGLGKRFFRAMSITEDKDSGTYTINAVEHIPEKESVVDSGVTFEPAPNTIYDRLPAITGTQVDQDNSGITISWSGSGSGTEGVTYQVKVYRDNLLMDTYNDLITPSISLNNLKPGRYKLEIRARNKNGQWSEPQVREFDIDYSIYNFRATPKLWSVQLDWDLPNLANSGLKTEIWVSASSSFSTAHKVADVASPTNTLTHSGLKLEDKYYYWARLVDKAGFTGEPVGPIEGESTKDPSAIVEYIEGQITEAALHKDLVNLWQSNIDTAISKEAQERIDSIQQSSNAAASALLSTANQLGTRIDSVDNVTADLAQQLSTVTAAQGGFASGLQTEILARIAGDQAEATARQTLAAQVGNNTSAINASSQAVSDLKTSTATQFTNVNARIDNINPDMLVGITLEAGWVSDTNGTNQTLATHKRTKDYLPVYELVSYVACVTDVTADFNLRVVWYDQNKAFLAGSVVTRFSGAKSFTAPSGAMYVRVSWVTAALKSISFTEVAAIAASAVAADLADYKQAQAGIDAAQTLDINAAKSRLGAAESSITNIQTTYAKKTEVVAMAQTGLQATWQADAQARVDALTIGSRNYLLGSKVGASNKAISTEFDFMKLAVGAVLSLSFDIEITAVVSAGSRNRIGFEVGVNNTTNGIFYIGVWLNNAASVTVGKQRVSAQFAITSKCSINPKFLPYYNQTSGGSFTVSNVKLEIGNKPTDWLPAPEDTSVALDKSFADISTLQTAVANQTSAMATMNTTLTARIDAAADSGGDNLIDNGNFERGLTAWDNWGTLEVRRAEKRTSGVYQLFLKSSDTSMFKGVSQSVYGILPSQTYTLSFMAARASADGAGMGVQILIHQRGDGNNDPQIGTHQLVGVSWQKCTFTFTTSDIAAKDSLVIFLGIRNGQAGSLIIRDVQLEMGSVATAFKPSINGQARKVQAMYSLKVEAFGSRKAMAGIAIGADGETGDAEVLILGNKFMIADPNTGTVKPMLSLANVGEVNQLALNGNFIANGTVLGRHIKANETITAPVISGGTISGTTINGTIVNGGTIKGGAISGSTINVNNNFLVDSSGNMTAKSGTFDGIVTADSIDTAFAQRVVVELGVWTTLIGPSRHSRNLIFDHFKILLQRTNDATSLWRYCINLKIYIRSPSGVETLVKNLGMGESNGSEVFEQSADRFPASIARDFNQLGIAIPKEGCSVRLTVTAGTRRTNGDGGFVTDKNLFMLDNDSYQISSVGFDNDAPSRQSASISRHLLMATLYRS